MICNMKNTKQTTKKVNPSIFRLVGDTISDLSYTCADIHLCLFGRVARLAVANQLPHFVHSLLTHELNVQV